MSSQETPRPEGRAIDRLRAGLGLLPLPDAPVSDTNIEPGKVYGIAIEYPASPDGSPDMADADWPI